ncbi:MAG: twin-arginine translocase subunit TatC [Saprospiraceae bacterium]|nr:twin-arginine translocase subunit TatC [Saprospiraceae bacterium]
MALDQVDVDKLNDDKEMSFMDHLEHLRWHIFRSVLVVVVFSIVAFLNGDFVFKTIIFGPKNKDFITYRVLCSLGHKFFGSEALCFSPPDFQVVTRELGEQFMTHFNISFWIGLIISFPYILWEIWRFIKPGLYEKERKSARGLVFVCSVLFLVGVLFGYFVLSPFSISFLAGYDVAGTLTLPTLDSYVSFMTMFTIPVGLIFELPVAIYFLAKIGLITAQFMKDYRRHAIVVILIIAGIITPPDVTSQILVTLPLIFLYEASIIVAQRVERTIKKKEEEELKLELKNYSSNKQS